MSLTTIERNFVRAWTKSRQEEFCTISSAIASILWLALFIAGHETNVRNETARLAFRVVASIGLAASAFAVVAAFRPQGLARPLNRWLANGVMILIFGAGALFARLSLQHVHTLVSLTPGALAEEIVRFDFSVALSWGNLAGVSLIAAIAACLALTQMPAGPTIALAVVAPLLVAWAVWPHPDRAAFVTLGTMSIAGGLGAGMARLQAMEREALAELERRRLEAREAVLVYEKDLEIAELVRSASKPPPLLRFRNDTKVHSFWEPSAKLGRSWLAAHETSTGQLVMIVADVKGKGLEAALVSHAMQSLWMLETRGRGFDAERFLGRMNAALSGLGQRRLQAAAVGVAVVETGTVTYWCAGHKPLQIVRTDGGDRVVTTLAAKGHAVGLGGDLALEPARLQLPQGVELSLLLGSEDLFEASLAREVMVLSLLDHMTRHGVQVVRQVTTAGDKTLLWAEVKISG